MPMDAPHGSSGNGGAAATAMAAAAMERTRADCLRAVRLALDSLQVSRVALVAPSAFLALLERICPEGWQATLPHIAVCASLRDAAIAAACASCEVIAYISPPQMEDVRAIAMHAAMLAANTNAAMPPPPRLVLFVAGRWTPMLQTVLERRRLQSVLRVQEIALGFVPLDADLWTLGRPQCLRECGVRGDTSALTDVARALLRLQHLFGGAFERIKCKGELASAVLQRMADESAKTNNDTDLEIETDVSWGDGRARSAKTWRLGTLVLLDRSVDYASALCTPLTYEAMLDELGWSQDGIMTATARTMVDGSNASLASVVDIKSDNSSSSTIRSNMSSDAVFQRLRDQNVQAVGSILGAMASEIQTRFSHFRDTSHDATAAEVHAFVQTVPQMKAQQEALERHVTLVEAIEQITSTDAFRSRWRLERALMDAAGDADRAIEEMIYRHSPLVMVLRILCLCSVVNDGLEHDEFVRLQMHLVRTYGHEVLPSLRVLGQFGLLVERSTDQQSYSLSSFAALSNLLGVIDLAVDIEAPISTAFVTSGYAPISCRLVEEILRIGNWEALGEAMKQIDGPRAEVICRKPPRRESARRASALAAAGRPAATVVCIIGGITYMEVAALRWLSQKYEIPILITSTSMINGSSMLGNLFERVIRTTSA